MSEPINIFDMVDPIQKQKSELLNKTIAYMYARTKEGAESKQIEKEINAICLPLDIHLCVFAKFSEICKYGRILTKGQRKILKS